MSDDDILHILSTAYVEWEGKWFSVPGGWVVNMRKAGLKVVSQPPAPAKPAESKTV